MAAPLAPSATMPAPRRKGPIALTPLGILGGALAGVGGAVLVQQYGIMPMTLTLLAGGVLVGTLLGILLPTLARAVGSSRRSAGVPASPVAPSVPQPAPTATPTATAPVETTIAAAWVATHRVPPAGLPARDAPDPSAAPTTTLAAQLPVQLTESAGAWGHVRAENGWTGWVDARLLEGVDAGATLSGVSSGDDVGAASHCTACGAPLGEGLAFCTACGAPR